jgi:hypothetical protein
MSVCCVLSGTGPSVGSRVVLQSAVSLECDCEAWMMSRPWPTTAVELCKKKIYIYIYKTRTITSFRMSTLIGNVAVSLTPGE